MALDLEVPLLQQGLRPDDLLQVAEILGKVSPAVNGYPRIERETLEREAETQEQHGCSGRISLGTGTFWPSSWQLAALVAGTWLGCSCG